MAVSLQRKKFDFSALESKVEKPAKLDFSALESKVTKQKFDFSILEDKVSAPEITEQPKKPSFLGNLLKAIPKRIIPGIDFTDPATTQRGIDIARTPENFLRGKFRQAAQLIPDPQTTSTGKNILIGLPKLGAEIVAEMAPDVVSPEFLLLGGAGAITRKIQRLPGTEKALKFIGRIIPETIRRGFTYRFGQPKEYVAAAEQRIFDITKGGERAVDIANPIAQLSTQEQQLVASFMKGEINDLPDNLLAISNRAVDRFAQLGKEAVDLGLLSAETYMANVGRYLPRLYRSKEVTGLKSALFPKKPVRIPTDRFKARKDIPEEVRESMGEILEAGYPTAKGLAQLEQAVATSKFFRSVAQNPEWVTASADDAAAKGFELVKGTSKRLGDLSGKFVHPEIARDIEQIITLKSTFDRMWGSFISKWKFGKVILNPATHFRNILSNSILLDMGGINHIEQLRLLPMAAKQMLEKGIFFKEAKEVGLLGKEFFGGEILAFRSALNSSSGNIWERLTGVASKVANKAGKTYQAEEQVFKMAKFIKNRELGIGIKEAAADAEKWLFNYEKVPPFIEKLRRMPLGSPFITFSSKVVPRLIETALLNPLRLYKYQMLGNAFEEVTARKIGLSKEDRDIIRNASQRTIIFLPFRDQNGEPLVLDVSYIFPWGDIGETGGFFGLPPVAPPSGPAKMIFELGRNENWFTNKPIWNELADAPHEKILKAIEHVAKGLLPSLTPGIATDGSAFKGGYSFQKVWAAYKKRPDYRGRVRSNLLAVLDTIFGIKISALDPGEQLAFQNIKKQRAIADLQRKMKRDARHPGISDEFKSTLPDKYQEGLKRIMAK